MATIEMTGVRKEFGSTVALADLHLRIEAGELVCLLGPSGCGKTTALRLLAGFEEPDAGQILVDGVDITTVPPRHRGFGMVFQEYSLFPNLTARQNIGFGLAIRHRPTREVATSVDRLLATTRLEQHADKYPHQMSGGQKQRVALARAIATEPRLLLLDEPLSALDAQVREHLRDEIRRLQQKVGVTTLFVTHDQHEAMAIADRVAVMHDGRLEQIDTPRVLYSRPATAFVAGFVGTVNRVSARSEAGGRWRVLDSVVDVAEGRRPDHGVPGADAGTTPTSERRRATAVVRPEQVTVTRVVDRTPPVRATVTGLSFLGAVTRVTVDHADEGTLTADLLGETADGLRIGDLVTAAVRPGSGAVVLQ